MPSRLCLRSSRGFCVCTRLYTALSVAVHAYNRDASSPGSFIAHEGAGIAESPALPPKRRLRRHRPGTALARASVAVAHAMLVARGPRTGSEGIVIVRRPSSSLTFPDLGARLRPLRVQALCRALLPPGTMMRAEPPQGVASVKCHAVWHLWKEPRTDSDPLGTRPPAQPPPPSRHHLPRSRKALQGRPQGRARPSKVSQGLPWPSRVFHTLPGPWALGKVGRKNLVGLDPGSLGSIFSQRACRESKGGTRYIRRSSRRPHRMNESQFLYASFSMLFE